MTLLLIDGNGLFHRAFHSTKANPQYRADGLPVAAIGEFLSHVWWCLGNVGKPQMATHGAVIFDAPGRNWRHAILDTYKTGRRHDDAIAPQLRLCREIVTRLGLRAVQQRGYEADDLIATYTRLAEEAGMATCIITVDKDMMCLIRPGVVIYNPMKNAMLGEADVVEKFGVQPCQVTDVQALSGDAVDGISGVPGIGEKTAADLIDRYGDLETLLTRAGEIRQPKLRERLIGGADLARQSYRLARLDDAVPVRLQVDELPVGPIDAPGLLSDLKALEIVQFARRFAYPFGLRADDALASAEILELAAEQMQWMAA